MFEWRKKQEQNKSGEEKEEKIDLGKRAFLKKTGKLAKDLTIAGAGVAIMGKGAFAKSPEAVSDSQEHENGQERDFEKDFNIGVPISDDEKEIDKIIGNEDIEVLSGGKHYYIDGYGLPYKRKAFAQMTEKYGQERIRQMLDFLEDAYPSKEGKSRDDILASYAGLLSRMAQENTENKVRLNKKLYNISDLLEKGRLEKTTELFKKLKDGGYSKAFDFSWDIKTTDKLLSDEDERKALIEFQEKVDGFKYIKLKEFVGEETFNGMSFKEKLKAYEAMKQLK